MASLQTHDVVPPLWHMGKYGLNRDCFEHGCAGFGIQESTMHLFWTCPRAQVQWARLLALRTWWHLPLPSSPLGPALLWGTWT